MDSIRGAFFLVGGTGFYRFFFRLYPWYLFLSIFSQHEIFAPSLVA